MHRVAGPRVASAGRPFARNSVWNTALPHGAALDRRSRARVRALVASMGARAAAGINPTAGKGHSTFYEASSRQRRVPVQLGTGPLGAALARVLNRGVPIPAGAIPAEGSGAHLVVCQPATDSMSEFWRIKKVSGAWHASWGGAS